MYKVSTITIITALAGALVVGCSGSAQVEVKTPKAEAPRPAPAKVAIVDDHLELEERIHFASGSDEILPDSYDVLDDAVTLLKDHGEVQAVSVEGHTDARGKFHKNQTLSEQRAESVARYLRERGVPQRVTAVGYGESRPLCEGRSSDCNAKNRRVEFLIENDNLDS